MISLESDPFGSGGQMRNLAEDFCALMRARPVGHMVKGVKMVSKIFKMVQHVRVRCRGIWSCLSPPSRCLQPC